MQKLKGSALVNDHYRIKMSKWGSNNSDKEGQHPGILITECPPKKHRIVIV
jgi:hypothetical protein